MSDEDEVTTAVDVILQHRELEREARRRFPWDLSQCTHHMDLPERQLLWACLTCGPPRNAICYGCTDCHAGHELVELWGKRGFTCDCGTTRLSRSPCKLRGVNELESSDNQEIQYNHNFDGEFCDCREHSNDNATGVMYQCLLGAACGEDWFHARCLAGISRSEERERVKRVKSDHNTSPQDNTEERSDYIEDSALYVSDSDSSADDLDDRVDDNDDDDENGDVSSIYPELPSSFAAYTCHHCVAQLGLEQLLGVGDGWIFYEHPARADMNSLSSKRKANPDSVSLFLLRGYHERFRVMAQSSSAVARLVHQFPALTKPERTYKPPLDEEANATLLEAGERALNNLPYEQAANGIQAYVMMRDKLEAFLAPFAEDGRVVTSTDVKGFFEKL